MLRIGTIDELHLRHCKIEPQIETIFIREYPPAPADALGFAPIGLGEPYRIIVQNNPVNYVDPFGLWKLIVGGSYGGIDISSALYNSDIGFFPSSKLDIGVSTALIGGGIKILSEKCDERRAIYPGADDITAAVGLSKYLGYEFSLDRSKSSINLGLGIGLPISFSTSIQNFGQGLGNMIGNLFGAKRQ